RHHAERSGRQSDAAGEFRQGVDRVRQGESREALVRLRQQRQRRSSCRRAVQGRHGRRHGPHPVQRRGPGNAGIARGRHAIDVRQLREFDPANESRQTEGLAVTTSQRSKLAPDLPTMAEAGVPGFDISTWFGLLAPAGTPPSIIAKWNADVTRILESPEMRERLSAQGAEALPTTPQQFGAFIGSELTKY